MEIFRKFSMLIFGVFLSFALSNAIELQCGKDHNCGMLPDDNDPQVLHFMKCGACQLAVRELAFAVIRKQNDLQRRLSEFESTGLLENFCQNEITRYGLELDANAAPLPRFTADEKLNRASGGWIKRQLENTCNEVISDYDSELSAAMNLCNADDGVLRCNPIALVRRICLHELKVCLPADFVDVGDAAAEEDEDDEEDEGDEQGGTVNPGAHHGETAALRENTLANASDSVHGGKGFEEAPSQSTDDGENSPSNPTPSSEDSVQSLLEQIDETFVLTFPGYSSDLERAAPNRERIDSPSSAFAAWSPAEVGKWLSSAGLDQLVKIFGDNEVDGATLADWSRFDEEGLKKMLKTDLEINAVLLRQRFFKAYTELKSEPPAADEQKAPGSGSQSSTARDRSAQTISVDSPQPGMATAKTPLNDKSSARHGPHGAASDVKTESTSSRDAQRAGTTQTDSESPRRSKSDPASETLPKSRGAAAAAAADAGADPAATSAAAGGSDTTGGRSTGGAKPCSVSDWGRYGRLLDVDDLTTLDCSKFKMEACQRCREAADCRRKADRCAAGAARAKRR